MGKSNVTQLWLNGGVVNLPIGSDDIENRARFSANEEESIIKWTDFQ